MRRTAPPVRRGLVATRRLRCAAWSRSVGCGGAGRRLVTTRRTSAGSRDRPRRARRARRARRPTRHREGANGPAVRRVLSRRLRGGDGHLSRTDVAVGLQRSTRGLGEQPQRPLSDLAPGEVYRADPVTRTPGGLLHHRFTLTDVAAGGLLSVALSRGLLRVGVTHRPALWSPDVPRRSRGSDATVSPTHSLLRVYPGPRRPTRRPTPPDAGRARDLRASLMRTVVPGRKFGPGRPVSTRYARDGPSATDSARRGSQRR